MVSISSARIHGLNNEKYYSENYSCYQWSFHFMEDSIVKYIGWDDVNIFLKKDEEEAEELLKQYKKNFENVEIYDGDEVDVLYGVDKRVVAIGNVQKDIWLDVIDNFVIKPFSKLYVFGK